MNKYKNIEIIYLGMNFGSNEPLLKEDENRFVMFPIQDQLMFDMYKKQIDCFWRVEEVD